MTKVPHLIYSSQNNGLDTIFYSLSNLTRKAASPPHINSWIMFARLHQCPTPSVDPPEFTSQMVSRLVQTFLHSSRQRVLILYNEPHVLVKLSLRIGGFAAPSNTLFLGPTWATTQMASQLVQPFLQGSWSWLRDQPTDRPLYPVCNNKLHLHTQYYGKR